MSSIRKLPNLDMWECDTSQIYNPALKIVLLFITCWGAAVARAEKATARTKQKTPLTILLLNCFFPADTELELSGYCEQAPFKRDSRGGRRLGARS